MLNLFVVKFNEFVFSEFSEENIEKEKEKGKRNQP